MSNLKKLTMVLVIVLLLGVSTVVNASNVTNIVDENTTNNSATNNTATNNTVNNTTTNNTTNNTSNTATNTTIPKAGSGETITILTVTVIFAISAIYAHKKIRDYNV